MNFKNIVRDMDAELFNEFSETAIYNGVDAVRVVIDLDVEQFGGFETTGIAKRHEISFLVSEISTPLRGQTIETNGGVFSFDGSISNDGHVARWHINAR